MVEDFSKFKDTQQDQMDAIPIEFRAGLYGGTPLLIGDTLKDIESVMFELKASADISGRINQGWPTFGLNDNGTPIETTIRPFPADIYANELTELHFSSGFTMECLGNSLIVTQDGVKRASDLLEEIKNNTPIQNRTRVKAWIANATVGIVEMKEGIYVESGDSVFQSINRKVFFSKTECGNILLPYFSPKNNSIVFIDVML